VPTELWQQVPWVKLNPMVGTGCPPYSAGNEVVVLKKWLADLLYPRQESSDAQAKKLRANDLAEVDALVWTS
jgi:hypothetical protein